MNIALIYENINYQNETAMLLVEAGYTVNQTYEIDSIWFHGIKKSRPDILIISVVTANEKLLQQLGNFKEQAICPVIVLAKDADISITQDVILAGADSCVTGILTAERMKTLIEVSLARFKVNLSQLEKIEDLNNNIDLLETRLSDRKDIEKAKGMLMNSYNMNEDDAYNAMRRIAMDSCTKLGDVSRNIISMANHLDQQILAGKAV